MKKKVGILTLQFANNYGGLLQTFALVKTLKKLGVEPTVLNRIPIGYQLSLWGKLKNYYQLHLYKSFTNFRKEFLPETTEPLNSSIELSEAAKNLDAVVVGSDQVWRLEYTRKEGLEFEMFLNFLDETVDRISYAASFGKDVFEGSIDDKQLVSSLLKKFKKISVREKSGQDICSEVFGVEATHVLDPTMLLDQKDYEVFRKEPRSKDKSFLTYYFLDHSTTKMALVERIAKSKGLKLNNIYRSSEENFLIKKHFIPTSNFSFPSFEKWICGIMDANLVIADSFHGIVFSILFNKEFICIGNAKRGLERMVSLLEQFGLQDRLFTEDQPLDDFIDLKKIDFRASNEILRLKRVESLNFLKGTIL